ncbi:Transcriptional regulator, LysR family (plasmid) [Roseomonas mucosa]|uniref:Transcriptional regulator, LysR family n=1 Tax=Roseomonas mucosa TaxID=207340 RepID=A0A4Y1MRV8_9PROT|nr:LysR family transcriptional regulator [Roseomonas mucosa]AWV20440.1 Transcriptional regulator, LysR family [Roseomonas mucosa]MDT8277899.1 LysR family transcriptional regulator [Roseomonas mucosa]MDT8356662.1 LysR family transcriptional regulator [Roseomonas mucosa]MDU7522481.1 LysR family transcriptional regulator [Roseomonas mucosa]
MRINLNLQQLSAFLQLARTGSFSEAARQLGVSQPALSRMVQQMEETVGARLFDRTTRSVALTPTGQDLRPIAERLVAEFDSSFSELGRFIEGRRGRVAVAALPSVAAVLLPPAIAQYRQGRGDVEVAVLDGLSGSVLDAVTEGRADIGLTIRPSPRTTLSYRPLVSDEFGLVCRPDDALAGDGSPLPWSAFEGRPFVAMAPESSVRQMTDAAFLQAGLAIPPLYGCAFLGTTGHLVASGLGITALPRLTMPLLGRLDLVWRRLEHPVMRRQIGVVTQSRRSLAPAALAFLAVLEQQARIHG